jgi:hypothetical protein
VGVGTQGTTIDRAVEREDDLSLVLWLVKELERFEAQPEAGPDARPEGAERRLRGRRRAAMPVAVHLDED